MDPNGNVAAGGEMAEAAEVVAEVGAVKEVEDGIRVGEEEEEEEAAAAMCCGARHPTVS